MTDASNQFIEKQSKKEISATARWGIGIIVVISIQTLGFLWYQSSWQATISSQVAQNAKDIDTLKNGAAVILTRDQLNDILNARDVRLDNIDRRLDSIDQKLDRIIY